MPTSTLFEATQNYVKTEQAKFEAEAKKNPFIRLGARGNLVSAKDSMQQMKDIDSGVRDRFSRASFNQERDSQYNQNSFFSKLNFAGKTAGQESFDAGRKVGKFGLDLGKAVLQAPGRTLLKFPIQITSDIMNLTGRNTEAVYTPTSKFEKAIFGDEPIRGTFNHMDHSEKMSQEFLSSGDVRIDDEGFRNYVSKFGSPMWVAGMMSLDLLPIGGGGAKKKAAAEISKLSKTDDILKSLKTLFKAEGKVSDDQLRFMAGKLKEVTDPKRIEKILGDYDKILKDVVRIKKFGLNKVEVKTLAKDVKAKVVKQTFRTDKLNLPKDIEEKIVAIKTAIGEDTRAIKTFKDMEDAALTLGMDVEELITSTAGRKILSSDESLAIKGVINGNARRLKELTDTLGDTAIVKSADEVLKIEREIAEISTQTEKLLSKVIGGMREQGRALVSNRILANTTMEPQFWLTRAKKMLGDSDAAMKKWPEVEKAIIELVNKNDRTGLAMAVANLRQASKTEKGITLWKAGLLTSPTTQLANVGGNITMRLLLDAADIVGQPMDMILSLFTHKRTTLISPKTIAAEARGLRIGAKEGKQFLKDGIYSADVLAKWDIPKQIRFENKALDAYVQGVFRSLGAGDIVFRKIAMEQSFQKQAMLIARNEGLRGAKAVDRTRELLVRPTNEMVLNAIDAAEYATFQSDNILAKAATGAKKGVENSKAATVTLEGLMPFVKTPTNIAARIADFTPAGFVKMLVKQINPKTRGQKAFVEDFSRAVTGTGVMALGALLAKKGLMTGNIPADKRERDDFFAAGKQANSIYLFGKWRQLNRISPVGNILALGADIFNISEEERQPSKIAQLSFFSGIKSLTEQSFLKGLSGGLKAVNDPEKSAEKFISQSVASVIPSIVTKTGNIFDPSLRNPDGVWQTFQARIPILNKRIASQRDVFGNIVEVGGGRLNFVDPFASKDPKNSAILDEAAKLDIALGMPAETVSGVKMDAHEYEAYMAEVGPATQRGLNFLIESDIYKDANKVEQEDMFKRIVSDIRGGYNDTLFPAIIIDRYELPKDLNPRTLREVLKLASKEDEWKAQSEDWRKRFLTNTFEILETQGY